MSGFYADGNEILDATTASVIDRVRDATEIIIEDVGGAAWAELLAHAVEATHMSLEDVGQELLDAIGDVMPRLAKLESVSHEQLAWGIAEGAVRPRLDLSRFFRGCNESPNLRELTLYETSGGVSATTLAPPCHVTLHMPDDSSLWPAMPATRTTVRLNRGDTIEDASDVAIRALRERPPVSLTVYYATFGFRKRIVQDFLDFPIEVKLHHYSCGDSWDNDRILDGLKGLRALFVLATAASGPASRFYGADGDGSLFGRIKQFL